MSTDSLVRLDEICEIRAGGTTGLTGKDFIPVGVAAYGAGGLNGYLPTSEYNRAAVILSSIGARCGKCFYVDGEWISLANTQILLPDPAAVDTRFLWYQLDDERRWHRSGSAQPFIKPSDVKSSRVFLPPIEEQRRIARVLDAVNVLRGMREDALSRLDSLIGSIFHELFVVGQRAEWPTLKVADLAAAASRSIRTGPFGSQLLHSEFTDDGVAVLGIDNAVQNEFQWAKPRFITWDKYEQLTHYTVHPGDVLITIMGTCGRAAIVPDDIPTAINTKHLCCITLDQQACRPSYLHSYFLRHPSAASYLSATAKGAVMSGLNMGIIKDLPVSLPPMALQRHYEKLVHAATALRERQRSHDAELGALFTSLRTRAFKGEL